MPDQADPPYRQPLLHDLVSTIAAPTSALSGGDGQIRHTGAQGLFHADRRALSLVRLLVDGKEPEPVSAAVDGAARTRFVSLPRWLGDDGPDPTVRVDRTRTVTPGGMSETIEISSVAARPVTAEVSVELGCDLAPIERVKDGMPGSALPAEIAGGGRLSWHADGITVDVHGPDAHARPGRTATLTWPVTLAPRQRVTLSWSVRVTDPAAVMAAPSGTAEWTDPGVEAADHRLVRLLARSLDDLRSLRLTEADAPPGHTFIGAGVPWYLTLFGRDSLWTARMMLPLGTALAEGTLLTLARRQGVKVDKRTGEAPGKIMHELRRGLFVLGETELPAAYYGTIDATLLWINLLHDAWRWGMPEDRVAALLPALEAALGWLADHADPDGDGFIEYIDEDGRGLANQGWKDSGDAMRFHDGRQADPPIALAEVQGYAYEAALNGAALLDAFGRPGASRWRDYAADMAERFRARFWVDGPHGRHPALALDAAKRPVDSLTSNIGHLLGTGMLTDAETDAIAALLVSPGMAGGYGLRTMSADDRAFNPLSYHCGSIWTHDTAIVIDALARAGRGRESALLARSLLDAAEMFDYRLPELYGGDDRGAAPRPVPYPAACRPQAWSAAAAVCLVRAALGVEPDVPSGRVTFKPLPGAPFGPLTVCGLRIAGAAVDVTVSEDGEVRVTGLPSGLNVETA
ncbi:glycogen debranching N-terminal domain-containing protein [Thermostaphylospora chromogena]|uniref:Glycogen debranching enzyme (Alpha-1,6-glucosidase) n=1 Tax=Thermostaphylospora chromogena TaxID=35622 RepID=A0A1H1ET31_9ACTN|nr:glycogen debranching N-terminal domain-containing protein [Thermostaphylospora chromogena]SDQ91903.1 Glycogen debranching enzyme (alpha-1,6-glucosidase) [Thermostaphylospora chromogena]